MSNSLFRTKKIENILAEGSDDVHGGGSLKRVLSMRDLTFFGIAAILVQEVLVAWVGPFFMEGQCGHIICDHRHCMRLYGPVLFGICQSYTGGRQCLHYAYASFGELFAWIIGWALIMEYSIVISMWLIAGVIILLPFSKR
jgi:hypothetical protein